MKNIIISFIAGLCWALVAHSESNPLITSSQNGFDVESIIPRPVVNAIYEGAQGAEEKCTHVITTYKGENNTRKNYTYDDRGNLIQELSQSWSKDLNDWEHQQQSLYSYDENGILTQEISQKWSSDLNGWIDSGKFIFDKKGQITLHSDFSLINGITVETARFIYDYDNYGNKILEELYSYSFELNKLIGFNRHTSTYNEDGNETSKTVYRWSTDIDSWIPSTQYSYNYGINESEKLDYYFNGTEWIKSGNLKRTWDVNGNKTFEESCRWINDSIVSGQREYWTYDLKNREIEYLSTELKEGGEWLYSRKRATEYNTNSFTQLVYHAEIMSWGNISHFDGWSEHYKTSGNLDTKGRITNTETSKVIKWDSDKKGTDYSLEDRYEYAYDHNDSTILYLHSSYDKGKFKFAYKEEFKFDNEGRKTMSSSYDRSNEKDIWIGREKSERAYDYNGKITINASYYWSEKNNDWEGYSKSEMVFDDNGLLIKEISYKWSIDSNDWSLDRYTDHTFKSNGNPYQDITYYTRVDGQMDISWVTTYYYGDPSGIPDIEEDSVSITFNGSTLLFSDSAPKQVFYIDGRLVYSGNAQSIELPSKGIYIVHTRQGKSKITMK